MPGKGLDFWGVSLFSSSIRLALSVWECLCLRVRIRFGWIEVWGRMGLIWHFVYFLFIATF